MIADITRLPSVLELVGEIGHFPFMWRVNACVIAAGIRMSGELVVQ
jgi:hypothetical protein